MVPLHMCYDAYASSGRPTPRGGNRYPTYYVSAETSPYSGIRFEGFAKNHLHDGAVVCILHQGFFGLEYVRILEQPLRFWEQRFRNHRRVYPPYSPIRTEALAAVLFPAGNSLQVIDDRAQMLANLLLHNLYASVPSTAIDL